MTHEVQMTINDAKLMTPQANDGRRPNDVRSANDAPHKAITAPSKPSMNKTIDNPFRVTDPKLFHSHSTGL